MTAAEIYERISGNLYDEGMVRFTDDAIRDSVQDGYDEIALLTGCIEKIDTLNFSNNLSYYNFRTLISDYYRPLAIWNNNINRWLNPIAYRELREYSGRWETLNGQSTEFATLGWEYVILFKKMATASGDMLVFYKASANTLIDSDTPILPPANYDILVDYGTSDLLDSDLEYKKAQKYYKYYLEGIKKIRQTVNSRSLPDRIYTLMMLRTGQ